MTNRLGRILLTETRSELTQSRRAPEFVLPTLLLPVVFYLIFGVMMSRGESEAATFLLATYGVFAVMGPSLFGFGAGVASEREKGWLSLKRAAPAPAASFIGAKLLSTLVFASLALLPIYLAAAFLGGVELTWSAWLLLMFTHLMAVIPFSLVGLILGFSFGANAAIAMANIVFLGFAVLGGLWFPIQFFPTFMQTLAYGLPSFHLAQISLWVVNPASIGGAPAHLGVVMIMSLIFASLAGWAWAKQR